MRRTLVVLLAMLPFAACGDDKPEEVEGLPTVEGAPETTVEAANFTFSPAELTMRAGEPLNIVLVSVHGGHNLGVAGTEFLLPIVDEGEQTRGALTIDEPGTYDMVCTVPGHLDEGMRGTIVVEG